MPAMPEQTKEKDVLRAQLKELRRTLSPEYREQADTAIAQHVIELPAFKKAHLVLPYLAFGTEVQTRSIIAAAWKQNKEVALPYCVPGTRNMRWYQVNSFDDLVKSSFGVLEPNPETASLVLDENQQGDPNAIALVPGLTFDEKGFRLGYGGGFYDVFLSRFEGASIGLCRETQISKDVPFLDPHDLPVDLVVTDERVIVPEKANR